MRTTFTVLSLAAILAVTACKDTRDAQTSNGTSQAVQSSVSLSPEELGALGAEIRKSPDKADEILKNRGMTRDSFETAIRTLSENPEASKRYAAEYAKRAK